MYIKSVRIQNFKSYRDKVQCGPLSPMHNSIVGMNGSGKSNFFAALRFVLSDAYSNMRAEDRAKLINEGAGQQLPSAFVEIVFDNSDHRLDNDKEEVTIRRQIGLKKDEYFIDSKHVTKQDIANMLETAGFSKSNPYYIVEQGKVTKITEMTDKQRLELLQEVAGTNVYEEKKAESEKIMNESDGKMREIIKNLTTIEDKLKKLDAEKEELSQYYSLDKERRSLQHSILSQKIKGLHEELTSIEHERQTLKTSSTQSDQDKHRMELQIQDFERQLEGLDIAVQRLTDEKAGLDEEEKRRVTIQHRQSLKVKDLQTEADAMRKDQSSKSAKRERLASEIEQAKAKLAALQPILAAKTSELKSTSTKFEELERGLNVLAAIRGHSQLYKSKADRDVHLKSEIKSIEDSLTRRNQEERRLATEIQDGERSISGLHADKDKILENSKKIKDNRKEGSDKLRQLESRRLEITRNMASFRGEQDSLQKSKEQREITLKTLSSNLNNTIPPPAAKALRFLKRLAEKEKIVGYYGPVIDLFECAEQYNTAIEQVGGARLFNIVVEDDNVASRLMKALQQSKEGRTQFLPLSRLRPEVVDLPTQNGAKPVISCMRFEAKFKPAMLEIFGKTLLCENYDVASDLRRTLDVACVTLDGDKFSKKGSIKGGYHDTTRSQILLQKKVRCEELALEELIDAERKCKEKIRATEQADAAIAGEKDKLMSDLSSTSMSEDRDRRTLESIRREITDAEEGVRERQLQLERIRDARTQLENKSACLKEQLASAFSQSMTSEQEARMKQLTEEHTVMQKILNALTSEVTKKSQEENDIQREIKSKTDSLEAIQEEIEGRQDTIQHKLQVEQVTLQGLESEVQLLRDQREQKEGELEVNKQKIAEVNRNYKKVKEDLRKFDSNVDSARKKLDQLQEKKNRLIGEMDGAQAQLRELGSLPEAFDKYKNRSQKQLMDDLHKVTEKLKAFKDVNKKALDQFNQFTEQREKFKERREELEDGAKSIKELMKKLDEKKDEAIQNTFRMVARNFKEVFRTLVPGGSGELIMNMSGRDDEISTDQGEEQEDRPRSYVGVSVNVKFAAGGEVRVMRSLSGGQKTVVALSIIFAIQKCDPAPFYLFDEVDANLDPMYRAALAKMISKQKNDGESQVQFITSSFQPELAQAADSHWVTSHDGMSRIVPGTIEDQLKIIKQNQQSLTTTASA